MNLRTSTETPVGIRDLAKALNVSIGTVSRSLNNRYGVNAETRARVLEAAQRLGYVPNRAARQLKDRPAFHIGLLFHPFYGHHHEINPYATAVIKAVQQACSHEGLAVDVIYYSDDDELEAQLDASSTDVVVTLGHFEEATFQHIHELGKPSINLEHRTDLPDQVAILSDGRTACGTAVQYLAALGHERIALVNGPALASRFAAYTDGFREAMAEFRLPLREEWVVELDPAHANAIDASAATRPLLSGDDRPTAIIFGSDWLAVGGVAAIRDAGLRVGDDVSVIGYDNLPQAATMDPPLTTFDMNTPMVGRAICRLTLDLVSGRKPRDVRDGVLYIHANLIKRSSCNCLR